MKSNILVLVLLAAGAILLVRNWKQPGGAPPIANGAKNIIVEFDRPKVKPTEEQVPIVKSEENPPKIDLAVKVAASNAVKAACLPGTVQLAPGFNWANLYEKPSTGSKVLAELQAGELICWQPAKDGFLPVKYGATNGFIVDRK